MSSKSTAVGGGGKFRWRVDAEKHVVVWNFERRGWVKTDSDDWNIYWASKATVKSLFNPDSGGARLVDAQYVSHFPNHYELTRKDLLVKNIKRYKKEATAALASAVISAASGGSGGGSTSSGSSSVSLSGSASSSSTLGNDTLGATVSPSISLPSSVSTNYLGAAGGIAAAVLTTPETLDFLPTTYTLPSEYSLFVEEFRRNPNAMWIMKPCSRAQGKGIFIINKLSQTKKWSTTTSTYSSSSSANSTTTTPTPNKETYVVSRYIERPLLVGGKKFDLRMYVLVVAYRPLQAFVYREGFARFCNVKYSAAVGDMANPFMHLTNVAVQKTNEDYNSNHGGKWSLSNLCLWVEATHGRNAGEKLLFDIHAVMLYSLRAVQNVIINDPHCFECYGYDIIIDDALKPWLVEVNASPSLTTTTREDRNMKSRLLRDVLELAVLNDAPDQRRVMQTPVLSAASGFQWLINETALIEADRLKDQRKSGAAARKQSAQWR